MQAVHNGLAGELCDLRNYIISQLLWNPQQDGEQLCQEFIRLHYAEAAEPILDYVGMLHDNAESRGLHPGCFPEPEKEVGLDAEISRRALAYFEQALELASSAEVRARVEKASICAHRAMIGTSDPTSETERAALIERYIDLARRYGMTHASERKAAEKYFEELEES